jgi:hypothetical protein
MRKTITFFAVISMLFALAVSPSQALTSKVKITKPSAPEVYSVSSSAPKKGKVNITVTISLPTSNGGSKITGSKVTAGGKSCTIKNLKTSCTIKGIKNGKSVSVVATSKNKKGFGKKSPKVTYRAGSTAYARSGNIPAVSNSLVFNTSSAVGVALASSTQLLTGMRNALGSSSNLLVTDSAGNVSNGFLSGSARISRIMISPSGDLFVVFQTPVALNSGATPCLLAKVTKSSGIPSCIDNSLTSISWVMSTNDKPIQFDAAGGIYYSGNGTGGKSVLRMWKDGITTDLINDNIRISRFIAVPTGGVIVSGTTDSTNAQWTRKINTNGGIRTLETTTATSFNTYADGNIYYGVWGPSDFGIKRYIVATDSLDPQYWISGDVNGVNRSTTFDVALICSGNDRSVNARFCESYGTWSKSSHSPIGGKTFIIAGSTDSILTQVFPTLASPQITIKKISLAMTLGGGIVVTGLNSSNQNSLIYFNSDSGNETTLLPGTNEIEIYHMAYNPATNKVMFDGLRFADNRYVFGQVDLGTNEVNIFTTLSAKWEDFQGFQ